MPIGQVQQTDRSSVIFAWLCESWAFVNELIREAELGLPFGLLSTSKRYSYLSHPPVLTRQSAFASMVSASPGLSVLEHVRDRQLPLRVAFALQEKMAWTKMAMNQTDR